MVSTDVKASPEQLFEIGKKLTPIREEGALIVASGNVVHNLGRVNWDMNDGYNWANAFDETIRDAILSGNKEIPVHYQNIPKYQLSVPTVEHYDPLLVALGATTDQGTASVWNEYRELGSMSMTSYLWEA